MFQTLSGKPVSGFCFGAMQFGGNADEAESKAMYGACREAGINFFDSAYSYNDGRSEQFLGKFVAPERDDIFVATKCASDGASKAEIQRQVAASLTRLGVDTIDLMYLHKLDSDTPFEESFEALAELVSAGSVRHIAVSNYAAWQVMKAQKVAQGIGLTIAALQPMYNLVKRQAEVEILPMAQSEGFAVFPYSPLGGGLLTGKYAAGGEGRLTELKFYTQRYSPDWMHEVAANVSALGKEVGVDPATLAVAWAGRHPGVSAPIISARSLEQLRPSLAAMEFDMDDGLYDRISALSRTPPPATDRLEEA